MKGVEASARAAAVVALMMIASPGRAGADDGAAPPAPAAAPAAENPNFTGTWKLDRSHSDDLSKLRPAGGDRGGFRRGGGEGGPGGGIGGGMEGGGMRGGGMRGGGMRGGGMRGRGEGGPPGGSREGGGRRGMIQPETLILDQHDAQLDFYDESRLVRSIDWGAEPDTGIVVHGTWNGRSLVATFTGFRGRSMQQTLDVSEDDKTLTVVTHLNRPDGSAVDLKSVYSHYEGDSP